VNKSRKMILAIAIPALIVIATFSFYKTALVKGPAQNIQPPQYVVLAWNNLGMHCYDPDFSNLGILPPYNTLQAQVIKIGDPPQIVTDNIVVEYSFPDNTYSVAEKGAASGKIDKSNFWQYAQPLFGLKEPLSPNLGLTGIGLSGTMSKAADGAYFVAEGIPLTDVLDKDAASGKTYPFQKALITVKDAANPTNVLAQITAVAPVSTELACANCHSDDGDATTGAMNADHAITPTGKTETNILALHDLLNGPLTGNYQKYLADKPALLDRTPILSFQPVLCATCHADAALGAPGVTGVSSLSNAMHRHHNPDNAPDISPDTNGCYNCHPGENTRCLRDTMSENFGGGCTDCHGDITVVAQNTQPWIIEPQCSNMACHGPAYSPNLPESQPLYRMSIGHGGVYCAACHDSPHAISPSREANDSIKFITLQGHAGSLSDCMVCHATKPENLFKHPK
jgi:hypothetical protein